MNASLDPPSSPLSDLPPHSPSLRFLSSCPSIKPPPPSPGGGLLQLLLQALDVQGELEDLVEAAQQESQGGEQPLQGGLGRRAIWSTHTPPRALGEGG